MKTKIKNIIYFCMIFLACGSYMIAHSTIPTSYSNVMIIIHLFDYLSYLLGFYIIIDDKHSKQCILYYGIIGVFLLFSALFSRDVILLKGFIIVIASKNIDIKEIIKTYLLIIGLFSIIIIMLCLSNMITDVTEVRWTNGNLRRSLGFSHPNRFGYVLFMFSMADLYIRYKKYNVIDIMLNFFMIVIAIFVANSKSAAIMMVAVVFIELYIIISYGKGSKWIRKSCEVTLILSPLISLYMAVAYNESNVIHKTLNEFITGRLFLANSAFKQYGFSVFGQRIDSVLALEASKTGNQILAIDNFYAYIAIHFGIIVLGVILFAFAFLIKKTISNSNNDIMLLWILLLLIYGLFENQIIDLRINFPAVILFSSLLKYHEKFYAESQDYKKGRRLRFR